MDIENTNGDPIISSFNAQVAKYFEKSNQVLVIYDVMKQSASDLVKLEAVLDFEISKKEVVISVGYASYESGGGTLYTVNAVESIVPVDMDCNGVEMLLFDVVNVESWVA